MYDKEIVAESRVLNQEGKTIGAGKAHTVTDRNGYWADIKKPTSVIPKHKLFFFIILFFLLLFLT
ncbi:hypothetical protein C900_00246 [Fulvivirga imtechensis AK7]|uniref:Uncharacterized protein n=1 Tax=Fulvivirga imtechensis AK7 TaxID=1237149 RepID=L8JJZ1_9BACT|nr:hypothetical protein C900_00246 [Fulvivirga imtechensis AK7]